jgi:biopolymer transport protein ExbD
MKLKSRLIGFSLTLLLMAGALSCRYVMPERNIDYNEGRVPVNLPRGLRYAETDRNMDKESAAIVSLPNETEIYVGKERTPTAKEELGDKLNRLMEKQAEPDRMVYLVADVSNNYGTVVAVCDRVRRIGVSRIGLLGNRTGANTPSRLSVELSPEPGPNDDLSRVRPNPLTLVVSIANDLRLRLNQDDIGSVNDSQPLSQRLIQIFKQRQEQYALRPGFETRTDLPMEERVEKTLIIKANRSARYGDVVKVVDAVRGAGASPVVLQIDDLPD